MMKAPASGAHRDNMLARQKGHEEEKRIKYKLVKNKCERKKLKMHNQESIS